MTTLDSNERDTSIRVHVPPRDVDEIGASNDITESQSLSPSLSTCISLSPPKRVQQGASKLKRCPALAC